MTTIHHFSLYYTKVEYDPKEPNWFLYMWHVYKVDETGKRLDVIVPKKTAILVAQALNKDQTLSEHLPFDPASDINNCYIDDIGPPDTPIDTALWSYAQLVRPPMPVHK